MLNIVGDLPTAGNGVPLYQIEGLLKEATAGGSVPVERKGIDPVSGKAIARCIFATNSLPNFADRSDGIWDRLRIIPFNVKFRNTEKMNPYLSEEIIAEELPGILNWSIIGLKKLRALNYFPHTKEGKKIAENHRLHCDHEKAFLSEFYRAKHGGYVIKQEIYEQYKAYCKDNDYPKKHQGLFNKEVTRNFPHTHVGRKDVKGKSVRVWEDITKKWF